MKVRLEHKTKMLDEVKEENMNFFKQIRAQKKKNNQSLMGEEERNNALKSEKRALHQDVESNPYLLKQYKKMVEEKDQIIKEMSKKFKKMNLTEKTLYLKAKAYEVKKSELEKIIINVKKHKEQKPITLDLSVSGSSLDEYEDQKYPPI